MVLGSTRPLTKLSTSVTFWVLKAADAQGWQPSRAVCLETWETQPPETSGPVKASTGMSFTYFLSDKENRSAPSDERLFPLVIYDLHDVLNYFPQLYHSKLRCYERLKCAAYVQTGKS
jgi:hypothetical protein